MYKTYLANNKVYFYNNGIEINNIIYPIHSDRDIYRIKRSIVQSAFEDAEFDLQTEIDKIEHTEIIFDQPTAQQLETIQNKTFDNTAAMNDFVKSVMNDEYVPSQEEINAMLMLEIAQLKVGASNE